MPCFILASLNSELGTVPLLYSPPLLVSTLTSTYVYNFLNYALCMTVLPPFVSVNHLCAWCHRSQNKVSDPLGLGLYSLAAM